MKKTFMRVLFVCVTACAVCLGTAAAAESASVYFEDAFDGDRIDTSKWNTDNATSGLRYCGQTGRWQDVSTELCFGYTQPLPYGFITVHDGEASFSSFNSTTFPYIEAGPPSRPSPFPASGDFIFEVRMKYDTPVIFYVPGLVVGSSTGGGVFYIWGYTFGLYLGGSIIPSPAMGLDYHVYKLDYSGGSYTVYYDGNPVLGPIRNALRPDDIWLGYPGITDAGPNVWSNFTVDYIRVTIPYRTLRIDIKPGSYPNSINLGSNGTVPVAIFGNADLDVTQINATTVTLAGAAVNERNNGTPQAELVDVDDDGYLDLVVHVITADLQLSATGTVANLEGSLSDGTPIKGSDSVRIVPQRK